MCDTLCALPKWSVTGHALFAKNADRDPNEPHLLRRFPRTTHPSGSQVQCTYIEVPQVEETFETILSKPDWIWGAEMGVNEHGVAIGNEAVFTRAKKEERALIGMDLLRLALERSSDARAALNTITTLLEKYGQGGNCGYSKEFRYDNSFLIADPKSAWVLETSGRTWAARPVSERDSISNRLTMGIDHTVRGGVDEGMDFARRWTEPVFSYFSRAKERREQTMEFLQKGPASAAGMIGALRSHPPSAAGREFQKGHVGSVCMHAGGVIGDHTTGSLVAVLRPDGPITVWATAASTPCISAFKPVFFGGPTPFGRTDGEAREYWLRREHIHRAVLSGKVDVDALRSARDKLEADWQKEEAHLVAQGASLDELRDFAVRAAAGEEELVERFSSPQWEDMPGRGYLRSYWRRKNATLGDQRKG